MKPVEFVLWLNGAVELVGDQPPTPEQWATMRGKLGEAVGELVAARLLERAEETLRADERRKKGEVMKQALEAMKNQRAVGSTSGLEAYKAQIALESQKLLGSYRALPAGTPLGAPEMPKPHDPGFLDYIERFTP